MLYLGKEDAFTVTRFTVVSQVSGHLSAIHKAIQKARIDSSVDCRGRVCNFLWAARSRLIDVGGDSVTK